VADDDVVSRTLTRESLAQAGFEVLEAEDGSKALQSFKETSPELVVLDAEMPNVDGVEACAAPRHLPHMPKDSAPSDPGPPFQERDTLCRRVENVIFISFRGPKAHGDRSERVLEESGFECTCQ
jgi:CheY-like chemotaxis protein